VVGKLGVIQKGALAYLQRRHALEGPQGPQDLAREGEEQVYDLAALRDAGLTDLADELERELGIIPITDKLPAGPEQSAQPKEGTT
jgi:hypothetical protein